MDVRLLAPLATLLAITVSTLLWWLNQRQKSLSYSIPWCHPVLTMKGSARDLLDIKFAGHNVANADLVLVRIFNSGHIPILASDYLSGLAVVMNPGSTLIAANTIETVPADLVERFQSSENHKSLIAKKEDGRVVLHPVMLNPDDSILLQLLVQNRSGKVTVQGHILGIKEVQLWQDHRVLPTAMSYAGALIMAVAMLGVEPSDIATLAITHLLPWVFFFLTGYALLSAGIHWPASKVVAVADSG